MSDTWLYVMHGAVYGWKMMNPLNELSLQSFQHLIKNNPPHLLSFSVHLTRGIMTLNFDEPVRPMTICLDILLSPEHSVPNHID